MIESFLYLFLVQGVLGVLLFEYAYWEMRRQREVVEERDREFPSWRRRDVHNWSRFHFYPGCFCFMMFRLVGAVLCFATTGIVISIIYIG